MIGLLLVAALAAAAGPGIRLGAPLPDDLPNILILDSAGNVATRVTCIRNQWVDPYVAAAELMTSTEVAATVIATDGHLTEIDQLGPAKFNCVLVSGEAPPG